MQIVIGMGVLLLSYIIGAIPFGWLIVKLKTGQDIRLIESGRTGGTNAMRAAGFWAGLLTAIMDILKGAVAVWASKALIPDVHLWHVLAPIAAILGHNYSIFVPKRDEQGRIVGLRGGAGGAPAVGGAFGLWGPSIFIIFPLGALVFFTVGIASITTMSVAFFAFIIFAVRTWLGLTPWIDILYGVLAELLLIWALRPNLKKLFSGQERIVKQSLHGWIKSKRETQQPNHSNAT
ncbi:MAG: glycerol-3-phosphate acyltransferase [Anaerolineales bacterium]|nr:glycerol-3-phosphate acyltransferase [Anaerolineales bacterium]